MHHTHGGKVVRVRRGIYRLVHFPAGEHEELVVAWRWSEQAGVLSHQTALALHGLSDVLPAHIHLTLPIAFRQRRLRVPEGIVLHYADVRPAARGWFGAAPVTTPRRTLEDCAAEGLSPELLRQAAQQAIRRGLVARGEMVAVKRALAPFGGIGSSRRGEPLRFDHRATLLPRGSRTETQREPDEGARVRTVLT